MGRIIITPVWDRIVNYGSDAIDHEYFHMPKYPAPLEWEEKEVEVTVLQSRIYGISPIPKDLGKNDFETIKMKVWVLKDPSDMIIKDQFIESLPYCEEDL